jgi:NAD+ synthetase
VEDDKDEMKAMRIALLQLNPTVGDLRSNVKKIADMAQEAKRRGASLAVASELVLCGYPPLDLVLRQDFLDACKESLVELSRLVSIPTLVGVPVQESTTLGARVYNAAVLCENGTARTVVRKQLLPNYTVFDERRYFEPGTSEAPYVLRFGEHQIGLCICEDIWNDGTFWRERRYALDPVLELKRASVDVIINLSASPFDLNKPVLRERMVAHSAKRHALPILMACQVGGNDQLLFDGGSAAYDAEGIVIARSNSFEEDMLLVDFKDGNLNGVENGKVKPIDDKNSLLLSALSCGIRDYVTKCGAFDVFIGLSGGIDSALVAALAVHALGPKRVHPIWLPSAFSSKQSFDDAMAVAKGLGLELETLPIEDVVSHFRNALSPSLAKLPDTHFLLAKDIADQNLQSRTRGVLLMALSNLRGGLVLATSNKSECAVGYATLYGDMCGALAPIGDLYKTQVFEFARYLSQVGLALPENVLVKAPTAELKPGQLDEQSLPPYAQLDAMLMRYIEEGKSEEEIVKETGLETKLVSRVIAMVNQAEYKRGQGAPSLAVSEHAFKIGWRWPLAKRLS